MGIEQFLLNRAKEEGLKKGKDQTTTEVVKNAHQKGLAIDFIAEIVNLPVAEVKKIGPELGLNPQL